MTKPESTNAELPRFLAERNAALASLDMTWARKQMPDASGDDVRLLAMHKARVECTHLHREQRIASVEWLRERGYRRMNMSELPEPGELPWP